MDDAALGVAIDETTVFARRPRHEVAHRACSGPRTDVVFFGDGVNDASRQTTPTSGSRSTPAPTRADAPTSPLDKDLRWPTA